MKHFLSPVRYIALMLSVCLFVTPATAEIFKLAFQQGNGFQFRWWPVLAIPAGWRWDEAASRSNAINVLVPSNSNFSDATTVMYAAAIYKPRRPGTKTIEQFIESDKRGTLQKVPDTIITKLPPLNTADNEALNVFEFAPRGGGNWEIVAYGEEGDFFLTFVVSSRTKAGLDATKNTYTKMLGQYKK